MFRLVVLPISIACFGLEVQMMSSLQLCGQRKMENPLTLKMLQPRFLVLLVLLSMVQQMMPVAEIMKPSWMIVESVKMSKAVWSSFSLTIVGSLVSKKRNFSEFTPRKGMEYLMVSDIQQSFKCLSADSSFQKMFVMKVFSCTYSQQIIQKSCLKRLKKIIWDVWHGSC